MSAQSVFVARCRIQPESKLNIQLGSTDFEMVVASSLSVLNEDMLEWSRDRNITFSVSLDGEEVVHNSNRILGHGLAYSRTVSGIEAIKRSLGADRVATVTTVTKAP